MKNNWSKNFANKYIKKYKKLGFSKDLALRVYTTRLLGRNKELIWILEHPHIYTAGTSFDENEILDKSINLINNNVKNNLISEKWINGINKVR